MKKLTVIIIILALVIISVFTYFYLTKMTRFCCLDSPCSDNLNSVIDEGDVRLCDTVSFKTPEKRKNPFYDNECREGCIAGIANRKDDPNLCSQISNIKDISSEEDKINGWQNLKKAGFSIKDRCYKNFAEELEDVSICAQSETRYGKETCKQLVESPELKQLRQKLREQQKN